jgi:hypothetical protein
MTRGGSSGGLPSTREIAGIVCAQLTTDAIDFELDLDEFDVVEVPTRNESIVVARGADPEKTLEIPLRQLTELLERCRS